MRSWEGGGGVTFHREVENISFNSLDSGSGGALFEHRMLRNVSRTGTLRLLGGLNALRMDLGGGIRTSMHPYRPQGGGEGSVVLLSVG